MLASDVIWAVRQVDSACIWISRVQALAPKALRLRWRGARAAAATTTTAARRCRCGAASVPPPPPPPPELPPQAEERGPGTAPDRPGVGAAPNPRARRDGAAFALADRAQRDHVPVRDVARVGEAAVLPA